MEAFRSTFGSYPRFALVWGGVSRLPSPPSPIVGIELPPGSAAQTSSTLWRMTTPLEMAAAAIVS